MQEKHHRPTETETSRRRGSCKSTSFAWTWCSGELLAHSSCCLKAMSIFAKNSCRHGVASGPARPLRAEQRCRARCKRGSSQGKSASKAPTYLDKHAVPIGIRPPIIKALDEPVCSTPSGCSQPVKDECKQCLPRSTNRCSPFNSSHEILSARFFHLLQEEREAHRPRGQKHGLAVAHSRALILFPTHIVDHLEGQVQTELLERRGAGLSGITLSQDCNRRRSYPPSQVLSVRRSCLLWCEFKTCSSSTKASAQLLPGLLCEAKLGSTPQCALPMRLQQF